MKCDLIMNIRFHSSGKDFQNYWYFSSIYGVFVRSGNDMDKMPWLKISPLVRSKGIWWQRVSVLSWQVKFHTSLTQVMSLWALCCALGQSHAGTEKGSGLIPKNVQAQNCPEYCSVLRLYPFTKSSPAPKNGSMLPPLVWPSTLHTTGSIKSCLVWKNFTTSKRTSFSAPPKTL